MKLTRHTPTVVLATVGLGASVGAWRLAHDYIRIHADAMHAATFAQTANTLFLAMEREMTSQLAVVHGLAAFYASSERVDRDEFETFTRTSLQRHPALVALLWAVRTDPADVDALRGRARAVGVTMPLDIADHEPGAQLRPASSRGAWYPVVLVEPAAARPAELGLDLAADASDRETLQRAVDTGLVLVTPPRQIKDEAELGFRSIAAVYKTGQRLDTVADRRDALDGFVAGVYRMDRLAHDALEPARRTMLHGSEVNLYIYSAKGDPERSPLLVQKGRDDAPTPASLTLTQALDGLHQRHVVTIEDRSWLVIARPLNSAPVSVSQVLSWITLLSGLGLTGAAMAGSMMLTSRTDAVETQVNARTAQLKAATQDLAERERRLRAIVDHTVDGIMTVDEHARILSANPAMERMFGYGRDEMLGRVATTLITDMEDALQTTGSGKMSEHLGTRFDGTSFPLELFISGLGPGAAHACLAVVRDVSDRKAVERMKDEFVSTVSHELRTPLTSMLGSLELVRDGVLGQLPPKAERMIEVAYDSGEHLVRLINDILDIERVGADRLSLRLEPIDGTELLEIAARANSGLANKAGVVLVRVLPTGSLRVMGDRDRLLQVLTNLLGNAVKFSPRGGRILLSLSRRDDRAVFSVSDEGPGISQEFRSRVFTPFSQADASDRRSVGGTGLGLSIAKAIVEAHDGHIWFENGDGSGTTFCFDLEITMASANAGAPA